MKVASLGIICLSPRPSLLSFPGRFPFFWSFLQTGLQSSLKNAGPLFPPLVGVSLSPCTHLPLSFSLRCFFCSVSCPHYSLFIARSWSANHFWPSPFSHFFFAPFFGLTLPRISFPFGHMVIRRVGCASIRSFFLFFSLLSFPVHPTLDLSLCKSLEEMAFIPLKSFPRSACFAFTHPKPLDLVTHVDHDPSFGRFIIFPETGAIDLSARRDAFFFSTLRSFSRVVFPVW